MARPADKSSNESEKPPQKPTAESTERSEPSAKSPREGKAAGTGEAGSSDGENEASTFVERMKSQHEALQAILDKRESSSADPFAIAKDFAAVWLPHTLVEGDVLRAAARSGGIDADAIAEVEVRKDLVNILLANLLDEEPRGAEKAALEALAEQFSAVAEAGKGEEEGLFQRVHSFLASGRVPESQIERRYERAKQRFERLDDDAIGEAIEMLAPRRLSVPQERQHRERERYNMPRYSSRMRERDDQGRFMSDDERDYGPSSRRDMPQRDESGRYMSDDERDYGRGSRRDMPQRDEAGRFMGDERRSRGRYEDDDDYGSRGGRRSMGRDYDDDRRSAGRGHGGWFGDSEGHSEASRRGWERSDHGRSGWYGDPEGHSEAARRGWERSDHGRSGWYGDPEGHSEAARRGRDEGHRSERRDDDNGRYGGSRGGYESRGSRGGRYEDDDERFGSSRGHGGWSGDPEGHSEAGRRGWERRR